jgi:hypothetical protein
MGTEYPDAIDYWVDRSHVFTNQNSHSAITLHGTGGVAHQTVEQLGEWFRTNPSLVSSHFGIGRDGRIAQYVHLSDGAGANGILEPGYDPFWDRFGGDNLNIHTISIEHVNDVSNSLSLTPAQQDASFKLVKWLCNRYNIPITNIKSHASIAPQSRARCPGTFPWEQLWAFLKEGTDMLELNDPVVRMFFTDGGNGTWKCKNGIKIWGENLKFYRSHGGPSLLGLPLAEEVHIPLSPEIAIVPCERALIAYDPAKKLDNPPIPGPCYLLHLRGGIGGQLLDQYMTQKIANLEDRLKQIKEIVS